MLRRRLLTVGIMVQTRHLYKTGLRLATMLATAAVLSACGMNVPFYGKVGESQSSLLGSPDKTAETPAAEAAPANTTPVAVSALDPLNAAPPTTTAPATTTAASHDALLVPAPGATAKSDGSQRVPLGTFGASAPASAAPTSITQPPAKQTAAAQAAPTTNMLEQAPVSATPPAVVQPAPAAAPAAKPPLIQPRNTAKPEAAPQMMAQAAPPAAPAPEKPASPPQLRLPQGKDNNAKATPRPPREEDQETVIISSDSSKPVFESREFVPASVVPTQPNGATPQRGLSDIPMTAAEKNVVQRFDTLRRLLDENLITQDEYNRRRNANIGALLPYTREPAALGLERSVPSSDAIMARLQALRRSFEMRAISATQHALERTMILNALLPETPDDRTDRRPPPEDVIEGAAMVGHLEVLRNKNLITAAELDAEKNAIEHVLRTGLLPSQDAGDKKGAGKAAAAGKMKAGAAAANAAGGDEVKATEAEITGPVLHLASFRSEESAKRAWSEATAANKAALASLKPIIKRVDLGPEKGIFYRLMAGPFKSLSDAESVCIQLKQNNQFCRASADGS